MIPRPDRRFQQESVGYDGRNDSNSFAPSSIFETSRYIGPNVENQRASTPSHQEAPTNRPRPGRRRKLSHLQPHRSRRSIPAFFISTSQFLFVSFWLVLFFCGSVTASDARSRTLGDRSELRRLARRGELLVDRSEPPTPRMRERRQETASSGLPSDILPTSGPPTKTIPGSSTGTNSPSQTSTSALATASSTAQSPLPSPFDSSLGNNFTSPSCPAFFQNFLSNSSFTSCLPFSLLLQTSNSFFAAERSLVRLTQTLDATCNVDFNTCNGIMSSLAAQITSDENCGGDFRAQNPSVLQAYDGFVSYGVLYHAGCQKDSGGDYCFANAATNMSSPTDPYPYYLPLGVALPGGALPTCNTCLQNTMAVFSSAASNATQPVSANYKNAAEQINMNCGPNFVNQNVVVTSGTMRGHTGAGPLSMLLVLVVMFWSWL